MSVSDSERRGTSTSPSLLHPIIEGPTIVVFDDSTHSDLYEMWLGDKIDVRTPSSCSQAKDAVDETTAVAVVRYELSPEKRAYIERILESKTAHYRVILTTSSHLPVFDTTPSADVCLPEPIDEETFCREIRHQTRIAVYAIALGNYYDCATRLAELRLDKRAEAGVYQRLQSRAHSLATVLAGVGTNLSAEDRSTVREMLRPDEELSFSEVSVGIVSKYRPDRCSNCGTVWQDASAYTALGAYVWKCDQCGTVHDRSDAANQRVAKRRRH